MLDKAYATAEWRNTYAEAVVKHLPKTRSDHCPILLDLNEGFIANSGRRPFKFEAAWQLHDGFKELLANFCENSRNNLMVFTGCCPCC